MHNPRKDRRLPLRIDQVRTIHSGFNPIDESWERVSSDLEGESTPAAVVNGNSADRATTNQSRDGKEIKSVTPPVGTILDELAEKCKTSRGEPENLFDLFMDQSVKIPVVIASNLVILALGFFLGRRSVNLEMCIPGIV